PASWKSRFPLAEVTCPKLLEFGDHVVSIPPNVTLFVTSVQSTWKMNLTRSGVILKLRRRLISMLYLPGLRNPITALRPASPILVIGTALELAPAGSGN